MTRGQRALARSRRCLREAQLALTTFRRSEDTQALAAARAHQAAQDLLDLDLRLKAIQELRK